MKVTWDPIPRLGGSDRSALQKLLDRHFSGVTPDQFAADLEEKTHAVRLWDDGGLAGFTLFAYLRVPIAGQEVGAVWSGDTIVDPRAWGSALLPAGWLAAVLDCHRARGRLAWCLICSGVRTWRMLPVFHRHYVPGADDGTLAGVRDQLAAYRYGSRFDPATGIVRLAAPQVLRPHLLALPDHLARHPHATDFLDRNPGHANGDELACATWVEPANMTPAGARAWRLAERLRERP